jgi:hypothetical protein
VSLGPLLSIGVLNCHIKSHLHADEGVVDNGVDDASFNDGLYVEAVVVQGILRGK